MCFCRRRPSSPLPSGEESPIAEGAAALAGPVPRRCHRGLSEFDTSGKVRPSYQRYNKPPYSYVGLIAAAIWASPRKCLSLAEITSVLRKMFTFFSKEGSYKGWQDSVRHNLSQNNCFVKVLKDLSKPRSKGNLWGVDWDNVPELAFQLQRTAVSKTGVFADNLFEQLGLGAPPSPFSSPLDVRLAVRNLHVISDSSRTTTLNASHVDTAIAHATPKFNIDFHRSPNATKAGMENSLTSEEAPGKELLTPGAQLCHSLRKDFSIDRLLASPHVTTCPEKKLPWQVASVTSGCCGSGFLSVVTDTEGPPPPHLPSPFWGAAATLQTSPAASERTLSPFQSLDFLPAMSPTVHWFANCNDEVIVSGEGEAQHTQSLCPPDSCAAIMSVASSADDSSITTCMYPSLLSRYCTAPPCSDMITSPSAHISDHHLAPAIASVLPPPPPPPPPPPACGPLLPWASMHPSVSHMKSPLEDFADIALTYIPHTQLPV